MMKIGMATFAALGLSLSAHAAERTFLPKEEVEALASGKKWDLVRTIDKNQIRWDLRQGGTVYGNNANAPLMARGGSGTWLINDAGQLCVKWRKAPDRCVAVFREGDKLKMADSTDLNGTYADLTVVP